MLLLIALISCTGPAASHDGVTHQNVVPEAYTDSGMYTVFWRSIPDPLQYGLTGALDLRVTSGAAPTEPVDAVLRFVAQPADGEARDWAVEAREDGHHRVDGVQLDQSGWWTWTVEVDGDAGADRVNFRYFCCRRDANDTG